MRGGCERTKRSGGVGGKCMLPSSVAASERDGQCAIMRSYAVMSETLRRHPGRQSQVQTNGPNGRQWSAQLGAAPSLCGRAEWKAIRRTINSACTFDNLGHGIRRGRVSAARVLTARVRARLWVPCTTKGSAGWRNGSAPIARNTSDACPDSPKALRPEITGMRQSGTATKGPPVPLGAKGRSVRRMSGTIQSS